MYYFVAVFYMYCFPKKINKYIFLNKKVTLKMYILLVYYETYFLVDYMSENVSLSCTNIEMTMLIKNLCFMLFLRKYIWQNLFCDFKPLSSISRFLSVSDVGVTKSTNVDLKSATVYKQGKSNTKEFSYFYVLSAFMFQTAWDKLLGKIAL